MSNSSLFKRIRHNSQLKPIAKSCNVLRYFVELAIVKIDHYNRYIVEIDFRVNIITIYKQLIATDCSKRIIIQVSRVLAIVFAL